MPPINKTTKAVWNIRALPVPPGTWILDRITKRVSYRSNTTDRYEGTSTTFRDRLKELATWALANKVALEPGRIVELYFGNYGYFIATTTFTVSEGTPDQITEPFKCPHCGAANTPGTILCGGCNRSVYCENCRAVGTTLTPLELPNYVLPPLFCGRCIGTCECGAKFVKQKQFTKCETCEPRGSCDRCGYYGKAEVFTVFREGQPDQLKVCPNCIRYVCQECEHTQDRLSTEADGRRICRGCKDAHLDAERAIKEAWPEKAVPITGNLVIPASPNRPVRTISIETEFDGSGASVGRALHLAGLVEGPSVGRYSEQGGTTGRTPCILKSDASVTGGELVTYLMKMDDPNHAAAVMRMTEVMRGCRGVGLAKFSSKAGGHIHIDLHGYGIKDVWVLYTLFRFLEGPLFYLAGGTHTYGHRSLKGSNYSRPTDLGPFRTLENFIANANAGFGRAGLNLTPFLQSRNQCACTKKHNHTMDKDCKCNLGKSTAEWRLWNAEITPRILHGWIALMQSLTAYAEDFVDFDEADYPYLRWQTCAFENTTKGYQADVKERLTWIFRELPFTEGERDSLIYCIKKSQLKSLGDEFIDDLLAVPQTAAPIKKEAPTHTARANAVFSFQNLTPIAGADEEATPDDDTPAQPVDLGEVLDRAVQAGIRARFVPVGQ